MDPVILRRPLVVNDLEDHFAQIHQDSPDAARRFKEQARSDFESLARMPEMGPSHPMKHPRLKDLRFWPIKGFNNSLIFYRPIANGIEVIRVLHGARDLPTVFRDET